MKSQQVVRMWVDDIRPPPSDDWLVAKSFEEAVSILTRTLVHEASLDHDLGACEACIQKQIDCRHVKSGYNLVCWMEETGNWPTLLPTVHSANPVGKNRMLQAIQKEKERRFLKMLANNTTEA